MIKRFCFFPRQTFLFTLRLYITRRKINSNSYLIIITVRELLLDVPTHFRDLQNQLYFVVNVV